MTALGRLPLADQPGERWRYHTGSDIVSVFVERVRGETLDVVLARDVFGPLAMDDTGFSVGPDRLDRLGSCRMCDDTGELVLWDAPDGRWSRPPSFRSGSAGMVSTVADLIAFGRMLLNRGEGPSGRILSPALVDEMVTDQLSDEQRHTARIDEQGPALGWGLGLAVRREPSSSGWPSVGSFGWDGGLGSRWIVDPITDTCAVALLTDGFSSPRSLAVLDDFLDVLARFVSVSP